MPTLTPTSTPVKTAAKPARKVSAAKRAAPARKAGQAKTAAPRKALASKTVASPTAKVIVKAAVKTVKALELSKIKAPKKPKLVRDSFTMPKDEYQAIDSLKQRAHKLQRSAKKSELLRAGIMALSAMDDKGFAAILAKVPALKTGRPGRD
jgi:hypothetical protein